MTLTVYLCLTLIVRFDFQVAQICFPWEKGIALKIFFFFYFLFTGLRIKDFMFYQGNSYCPY